jgi:2'-5' RNA ligase
MRLFVALDLEEEIRRGVARFIEDLRELAPQARWVNAESLHVTLKFIGEVPEARVKEIQTALSGVRWARTALEFQNCGFFPTAKAARVFWIGITSPTLAQLATKVQEAVAEIGIPKEKRDYSPHVTLARAPGGSGAPGWRKSDRNNRLFVKLQERIAQSPAPAFGRMTAREFFLYRSELARSGARYTKIARFALHAIGD